LSAGFKIFGPNGQAQPQGLQESALEMAGLYGYPRPMREGIESLTLEMLRAVRADLAEIRTEQREQRGRLGAIERSLAHVERDGAEGRTESGARMDRILDRLERIERRLDLVHSA